ncbi:MAG: ABC transporter substrate-binding protein [Polyangiales bacterium]
MMQRRSAIALLGSLSLAACERRRLESNASIELLIQSEPGTLDPRFVSDIYGLRIARLVHAALVAPDEDTLSPRPWLCDSIEEDGKDLVVTLREAACFHDGTKIRAVDVIGSFRAASDPSMAMPAQRIVRELASIDAIDGPSGRRVRFSPKQPRAVLRSDLELPILKASEAWRPRDARLTGSGPFAMLAHSEEAIYLAPSARYADWNETPAHRNVAIRVVRDEASRAMRILGGSADIASNALSPLLSLELPKRSDAPAGLSTVVRSSAAVTFLTFNLERSPLDQVAVRRAIAASIDKVSLVAAKFAAAATVASSLIPPTLPLAPRRRSEAHVAFDKDAAREVLSPMGRTGVRLTLVTTTDRLRLGIARAIAQMIGDAGITVDVRAYELATFLTRLSDGDFDIAPLIASEIGDPDVLRWYLHSNSIPPHGANRSRVRNAHIDQLLDRGLRALDFEQRRGIYEELDDVVTRTMPLAPLFHEDHVAVVSSRAHAFRPSADGRWGAVANIV